MFRKINILICLIKTVKVKINELNIQLKRNRKQNKLKQKRRKEIDKGRN